MSVSSSTTGEKSASPLIRRHPVITQLGPTPLHHPHHLYHNHHLHHTLFIPAVFVPLLSSVRIKKCHRDYHLESFSVTIFFEMVPLRICPGRCCLLAQRASSQTPAYASTQNSRKFLQAYISWKDSAHKQYQKRWHRRYVQGTHRRDSCMKGLGSARRRSWGSLPTHLQEVLPSCKGEQSLTFKRHQRSTVAMCKPSKSS